MLQYAISILLDAEKKAAAGAEIEVVLEKLRELSLDEFGMFLVGLPDRNYPALSELLPPMANDEVQKSWTGASGHELFRQTSTFVRQLENNYTRYVGRPLRGARILDFGCGYGRIFRMMLYYANPGKLWGLDAWQRSLDICKKDRLPGNFALSQSIPETLPVGEAKFDMIFSFSVFTHLSPKAAAACLAAIRRTIAPKGLFVCTVRPVEFWPYIDKIRGTNDAERMYRSHLTNGYAYLPHSGPEGETYGDSSIAFDYFVRPGWEMAGYDWSMIDPYQVSVILRPAS